MFLRLHTLLARCGWLVCVACARRTTGVHNSKHVIKKMSVRRIKGNRYLSVEVNLECDTVATPWCKWYVAPAPPLATRVQRHAPHVYVYVYVYVCACACACARVRVRVCARPLSFL